MKIFLVGSSGQIGAEIHAAARELGHAITGFTRSELDILDHSAVREAVQNIRPDAVINATGYHVLPDCERYPADAFDLNVFAVKNLAEQAESVGAYYVNYSTDKVFDGTKNKPHTEEDPANPLQVYGLSKLAGEIVTHNWSTRAYTIRTCGVFGGKMGSRIKKGNFVLYILREARQKNSLEVSSDQIASFVNAADLARATVELLEKQISPGVYHIVNDGYDSWVLFAREIIRLSGSSLEIVPVDRSGSVHDMNIPSFQALDNSKVKKAGISLSSWQDGLMRYMEYLRQSNIL